LRELNRSTPTRQTPKSQTRRSKSPKKPNRPRPKNRARNRQRSACASQITPTAPENKRTLAIILFYPQKTNLKPHKKSQKAARRARSARQNRKKSRQRSRSSKGFAHFHKKKRKNLLKLTDTY
jgi:hypothetical protein